MALSRWGFWFIYPINKNMTKFRSMSLCSFAAIGALLFGLAACGKKQPPAAPAQNAPARFLKPPPPIPSLEEVTKLMPKGFEKRRPDLAAATRTMVARESFKKWLSEKDHAEMVRPAPPGWKPESPGYKIKLTLVPQKTMLRKRESFWYRLELQNVGQEVIDFHDYHYSNFKNGSGSANDFDFYVTEPDGTVDRMSSPLDFSDCTGFGKEFHLPGEEQMTPAQRHAAIERLNEEYWREDERNNTLWVTLQPGETLLSRPWRNVDCCGEKCRDLERAQRDLPAEGSFRELYSDKILEKIGTHRMKVVYRNMPRVITAKDVDQGLIKKGISREKQLKIFEEMNRERLGVVESNVVSFEVSWW